MSHLNISLAQCLVDISSMNLSSEERLETWYNPPNVRGTWDILRSCFATIFLCTYTLLSLNVPPPKQSQIGLMNRRIKWMLLAILGPEIVLTYAAGQWSRACHSVKDFHNSGYPRWNMRLAFFADMGGFVLQPRHGRPFPLNAKQLHYLVAHELIEYPRTSPDEIWDKSKQDLLSKAIASIQATYVIVNCIARKLQGLAISTLELFTLGVVICSMMTVLAWYHKPADVRTPVVLHTKATEDVLSGGRAWEYTPLDFVDENGPGWSMNVQPFMKMPVIPSVRPITYIPNDRFPINPYGPQEYFVCLATLLFTGTHLFGWNFAFPTDLEQILWRVSSCILFGVTAIFWILETAASWARLGRWRKIYTIVAEKFDFPYVNTIPAEEDKVGQRLQFPVPWEFWSIMPVAVLYGLARLYQVVEALIEIRSLPATAFVSPEWTSFVPHI